jgi:hypothetical protein
MKQRLYSLDQFFREVHEKVKSALNQNLSISKQKPKMHPRPKKLTKIPATSFDATLLTQKTLSQLRSFSTSRESNPHCLKNKKLSQSPKKISKKSSPVIKRHQKSPSPKKSRLKPIKSKPKQKQFD